MLPEPVDKMRKSFAAIATTLALSVPSLAAAADYVSAEGSKLAFAGSYQGEVFVGRFPGFVAKLDFDPGQLAGSKLEVTIPMARATTDVTDYDGELLGPSFFDTATFAQARYVATKFRKLDDGRYAADGILTLRGASKPVTLTFTWEPGARPVLTGKATVRRLEFGVGDGQWDDTSLIPNEIAVSTRVVLQPAP